MLPHPFATSNFEIQKYQNEPKYNGVYSRDNLSKLKDGAYIINVDEFWSIGTHLIDFYVNGNNVTYLVIFFYSFIYLWVSELNIF